MGKTYEKLKNGRIPTEINGFCRVKLKKINLKNIKLVQ